jgi:hypothetical protein
MKNKHTPGEWSLPHFAREDQDCNCGYIFNPNGMTIGEIYYDKGDNSDYPTLEESQANAKLICAAPKMLEALQAFMNNVDEWIKTDIPADKEQSKMIYDKVKEAIKKATA